MKLVVVFVLLFASPWALPKAQNNTWYKRIYVDPISQRVTHDVGPRITGGKEATPHSIPYQASLTIWLSTGGGWDCGGSLITPRHILTAAHCLIDGTEAEITLGAHNIRQNEASAILVKSRNFIPHPDYDASRLSNDIGIIVLEEPVELNSYIQTVKLPSSASNDYTGETARVSGWGLTTGGGNQASPVLLEVYTEVISNQQCSGTFDIVIDSQICTQSGNGPEGHCNGDSGGPLTIDDVQIGVVSYGVDGCSPGYPSGYSRVTSYLSWIEKNTS